MPAKKVRKLFQVAKELKLASSTLTEELEAQGFEVTKKQMTPIPDEVYEGLLQKFAPDLWAHKQDELVRKESEEKDRKAQAVRDADLKKILESGEDKDSRAAKATPSVRHVEPGEIRTIPEPLVSEEEVAGEEPASGKPETGADAAESGEMPSGGKNAWRRSAEIEQPTRKRVDRKTSSMRGEVSNDDIVAFGDGTPGGKELVSVPTATTSRREPVPATQAKEKAGDEEKAKKRRRKTRKPEKAREATEKPRSGGWISTGDAGAGKRKRKRTRKKKVDVKEVQATIKQTMAALGESKGRKKKKRRIAPDVGIIDEETNLIQITEFVSTSDLAHLIDVPVTDLIRECLLLGLRVTINQRLDADTIQLLAEEHGYRVEFIDQVTEEELEEIEDEKVVDEGELVSRPPVVTIMGHVDHGKTSLLDYLRHSRIVDGEAGGITQHIGAYEVEHKGKRITFLDTPGHEAFTAMRARGAQVTDVVVLIVAADDQVMPQTVEAIDHARAAGVPVVVAINKMDKQGADADKVRRKLADNNLIVEEYGGDVQSAEISAKTGMGIEELLDKILVSAEMLELKAVVDTTAKSVIIESRLDKGRGTVCTVLVQKGTLRVGDVFVAGPYLGRIRAMYDETGKKRKEAFPGQPVEITGLDTAPHVGDFLIVYKDEKEARSVASKRLLHKREQEMRLREGFAKPDLLHTVNGAEHRELRLVIKGDVDGSVEAIADGLMRLSTKEVEVRIIHRSVGPINESDVLLASASGAMVIGFNIHPNLKAREMAQSEGVTIMAYRVIYELLEEVKDIIKGLHRRRFVEEVVGTAEVRNLFKISRIGTIAGCYVLSGKIERNNRVRVLRDGAGIYEGEIETLKRFKDDAKEVAQGYECGIKIANFNDIKVGDLIEAVIDVEVEREIEMEM